MSIGRDMTPILNCDDCGGSSEDAGDYRLLRDIEAMSKALCRSHPLPHNLSVSSSIQTPSSQKSTILRNGAVSEQGAGDGEGGNASTSRKSTWSWKKPLKALSRIRDRKFPCFFFLQAHSIEGLPDSFDESSFRVEFVRKDNVLRTRPSRVSEGIVDFDDTLMHRCTVYCRKINGPDNSCEYKEKLFIVRAYVNESPGIDLGKHQVDLTGLLPITFEELGGGRSTSKWTTSFKLAGEARGAVLSVSFGFSLGDRSILEYRGDMTVSELIGMTNSRSHVKRYWSGSRTDGDDSFGRLRRSGSVPGNLDSIPGFLSMPTDTKRCCKAMANPTLDLSKSIHFVYRKLDEDESKTRLQCLMENMEPDPVKSKGDSGVDSVEMIGKDACDEMEYVVIDRGIEVAEKEKSGSHQGDGYSRERSLSLGREDEIRPNVDEGTGLNSVNPDVRAHEVKHFGECCEEVVTKYRTRRIGKKSASLDLARADNEMGADFLDTRRTEQDSSGESVDQDPESPRERLLREFKEEALASGSFVIGFDSDREDEENASEGGESVVFDSWAVSKGTVIASASESSRDKHDAPSWLLKVRRELNMLEDSETEDFRNSQQCDPSGFGSPVELSHSYIVSRMSPGSVLSTQNLG